jgi:Zn-dependent peptidase ImmA (M78 family)/transcriptional regulator with XRE-family HTH domain
MGTRVFQPDRLRRARKLRGKLQNELAEWVGVTPAAISQYEAGKSVPSAASVQEMAFVLKCHPDFFFREPLISTHSGAFFRSLRRVPRRERDRAESYALMLAEIAAFLDEDVELPSVTVPEDLRVTGPTADGQIEEAAVRLRARWGVPPGPVANVVRLLEAHGTIVAAVGDFDERLDAFSLWTDGRPVTILCSAKGVPKRRRFDAAHELGHLVLHEVPRPGDAGQEREAHLFAAALLMPADEIEAWLPRRSNQLDLLQDASETWGVSMQALLYRARTLGMLSESSYSRAMRRMSARGWRTAEPVEAGPEEVPSVLGAAVHALEAAGGSMEALAARLSLPAARLARMLAVPEERIMSGGGRVLTLRAGVASG